MDVASDSAYLTMAKTGLHTAEMKLNETHSGNSMPVAATTAYRAGRSVKQLSNDAIIHSNVLSMDGARKNWQQLETRRYR
ncbi:hypothetical protein HN011_002038 [Eciton burchellii]|nr:hypothetical protein HN011_002038 [Eciton burchellii]